MNLLPLTMAYDRISIRNEPGELRTMSLWLGQFGNDAALTHEVRFALDLCANEAVSNIINYAYIDQASHQITLELQKIKCGARLTITDDGTPFDLLNAPAKTSPDTLDDAPIGGLGIRLIRQLASRLHYERHNGLNVLTLEFHELTAPGAV